MRRELKEANPDLVVYGCSPHLLNLLGDDLTQTEITKQVVEVNKYFCNHHHGLALLGEYSSRGAVKPQLFGATRWNSRLKCMEIFIMNRPFLLMIITQHKDLIEQRNCNIINIGLYRKIKYLLNNLAPVAHALDHLQCNYTSIADTCDAWVRLLREECLQQHKVQKQFHQAINIKPPPCLLSASNTQRPGSHSPVGLSGS